MNNWLKIVQHWLGTCLSLPVNCVMCLRVSQRQIALCQSCQMQLPYLGPACLFCALPLPEDERVCGQCLQKEPPFEALKALFRYEWPLSAYITQFKYGGHLYFGKMLAELMIEAFKPIHDIDSIVAMPLHPERQKQRGFNQTLELASVIAKKFQFPLDRWSCTKKIDTPSQSQLSAKSRNRNLRRNPFHISPQFRAKHVLVIEDVVTTQTTITAFATALKQANVDTVEIWSCCRTVL